LENVVSFAERPEHSVRDCSQMASILFKSVGQPVMLVHGPTSIRPFLTLMGLLAPLITSAPSSPLMSWASLAPNTPDDLVRAARAVCIELLRQPVKLSCAHRSHLAASVPEPLPVSLGGSHLDGASQA
jgi:hypothetical protein